MGPFRQANAWYLVEVTERRKVSLEDVQTEIAEELRTRRPSLPELMTWRNGLRQKSKVEILDGLGQ
jgi:parvulin-like peptidyl-prolyl isomerase